MSSQHHAKFTWGAGPGSVHIAGGFNNWSATATPLNKQPDGTFSADVPMPWGEKQAFKYVVDGEWKVREDEAKEWDAAGNMNNVYTAPAAPPPAPVEAPKPEPVAPVAPVAPVVAAAAIPSTSAPDTTSAPAPATKTESSTLLAASAPGAASSGSGPAPTLGGPVSSVKSTEPLPDKIEKTAATANVGAAPEGQHAQTYLEKASEMTGMAAGALGAVIASAAVAVEKATGVDLTHGDPMTLQEAKAKGINVEGLEKKDAPTDTVSPVGTKPPASGAEALHEKVTAMQLDAPAPLKTEKKEHDIPAQDETKENHTSIPMPVISSLSAKDPSKDRTLSSTDPAATTGSAPISKDPAVDPKVTKEIAETTPAVTAPKAEAPAPAAPAVPVPTAPATGPLVPGTQIAAPDAKSKNFEPLPAKTAPETPAKDVHPAAVSAPSTAAAAAAATTAPEATAPVSAPVSAPEAPVTPAKTHPAASLTTSSNGPTATPVSTKTDGTSSPAPKKASSDNVRKKKSSFFGKIKSAFSPKDKEKKAAA